MPKSQATAFLALKMDAPIGRVPLRTAKHRRGAFTSATMDLSPSSRSWFVGRLRRQIGSRRCPLACLMAKGAIAQNDGRAEQRNFDGYTPLYIIDAPIAVDVHIVRNAEKPAARGDHAFLVIWLAVVNAPAQLTGKRHGSLPLATLWRVAAKAKQLTIISTNIVSRQARFRRII